MKRFRAWGLLVLMLTIGRPLAAQEPFQDGEVFAGVADSRIARFSPGGSQRRGLQLGSGGHMTGMCFDLDGNMYATDFINRSMTKLDKAGRVLVARWGGTFTANPESCVVDGHGDIYVGHVDGGLILKLDAAGRQLARYNPRTEDRGVDWLDLAADQCTMLYTSEGRKVMRYDVCRNRQLGDLTASLEGACFALRVRENGEVMVACDKQVYRLSAAGSVVKTYPVAGEGLFAMNLDPDGEHFWTGGIRSGKVYKIHIGSGRGAGSPVFQAGSAKDRVPESFGELFRNLLGLNAVMGGLAVYGERTAAVAPVVRQREKAAQEAVKKKEEERQAALRKQEEAQQEAARKKEEERQAALRAEEAKRQREADAARAAQAAREAEAEAARQAAEAKQRQEEQEKAEAEAARQAEEEKRRQEQEAAEAARRAEEERRRAAVRFGPASPVVLGEVAQGSAAQADLSLAGTEVGSSALARLSTDFAVAGVVLELQTETGWVALGEQPIELPLELEGRRRWAVRARVGDCTPGVPAGAAHHLHLAATGADQQPTSLDIPLSIRVEPTPWLRCWAPMIAGGFGVLLLVVVIHGFVSPSRFGPRIGVVLSQEEDLSEGFFHAIRAQRGSGSGFYRDARIYLARDYRLTRRAAGALARLRAEGQQIQIEPMHGAGLERRTADGGWEPVPPEAARMRPGVTYRDDMKTIYFELANR